MSGLPTSVARGACIVLAGGLGTRLRSAVPDLPKCLAPVGERSFLDVLLAQLAAQGVRHAVLSLGYMADAVQRWLADHPPSGLQLDFVLEDRPLGTGGAMLKALTDLGLDDALVVNGDTFLDASLASMLTPLDQANGELVRMALVHMADRARYGGVAVAADGQVLEFLEKGRVDAGLINAGTYRVARAAFDGFRAGEAFSFETEVLPRLLEASKLRGVALAGSLIDIGIPDDYHRFVRLHG